MATQITSLTVVYSTVYSDADQRKHQSSASLAFVWEFTGTGEFPAQRASYAENVSIWWRHHVRGLGFTVVLLLFDVNIFSTILIWTNVTERKRIVNMSKAIVYDIRVPKVEYSGYYT